MPHLDRRDLDLKIAPEPEGLRVSQHGRSYLARRWRLTPQVLEVIDTAFEFGLTHLWQDKHPSGDESNHVSFSFSHIPDTWVFVIGKEALPPGLRCITFHKRLKGYLKAAGLGEWENSGGKNILVRPEKLSAALSALPLDDIRKGRLPQYNHERVFDASRSYVPSESALEDALYTAFCSRSEIAAVHRQQSFPPNDPSEVAARTDLILDLSSRIVIAELKVGNSSEADVAQVCRYRANSALRATYPGKPLSGALIASNFQRDAVAAAKRLSISLYAYEERGDIELTLVSGDDVLPPLV